MIIQKKITTANWYFGINPVLRKVGERGPYYSFPSRLTCWTTAGKCRHGCPTHTGIQPE